MPQKVQNTSRRMTRAEKVLDAYIANSLEGYRRRSRSQKGSFLAHSAGPKGNNTGFNPIFESRGRGFHSTTRLSKAGAHYEIERGIIEHLRPSERGLKVGALPLTKWGKQFHVSVNRVDQIARRISRTHGFPRSAPGGPRRVVPQHMRDSVTKYFVANAPKGYVSVKAAMIRLAAENNGVIISPGWVWGQLRQLMGSKRMRRKDLKIEDFEWAEMTLGVAILKLAREPKLKGLKLRPMFPSSQSDH